MLEGGEERREGDRHDDEAQQPRLVYARSRADGKSQRDDRDGDGLECGSDRHERAPNRREESFAR